LLQMFVSIVKSWQNPLYVPVYLHVGCAAYAEH